MRTDDPAECVTMLGLALGVIRRAGEVGVKGVVVTDVGDGFDYRATTDQIVQMVEAVIDYLSRRAS